MILDRGTEQLYSYIGACARVNTSHHSCIINRSVVFTIQSSSIIEHAHNRQFLYWRVLFSD